MIGRKSELDRLNLEYKSKKNNIVAIYGRRRIGKSYLIRHFCKSKSTLIIEGIEGAPTKMQITNFANQMKNQLPEFTIPDLPYSNWNQIFDLLTLYLKNQSQKLIIALDEFQWMAAQRSNLVGILKMYIDQKWNNSSIMVILCGSISSYMVKKVIQSKALYGRINLELKIEEFSLKECAEYFNGKLTNEQILSYVLLTGGVPKYLNEIDSKYSVAKNIDRLCFQRGEFLFNEFEKIFYSQFREPKKYQQIISFLSEKPLFLQEIASKLKMKSGGGLKEYLVNLELASFISIQRQTGVENSKKIKYRINDQFLGFYFKYMKSNRAILTKKPTVGFFQSYIEPKMKSWLGLAFENYCIGISPVIAKILKVGDEVIDFGPLIFKNSVQIDLTYLLNDKTTLLLCEIKYHKEPIGTEIIRDLKLKITKLKSHLQVRTRISIVLIAPNGVTHSLRESDFFDHIITINDLFNF